MLLDRPYRILLDPTAAEGGGTVGATTPPPVATPAPVAATPVVATTPAPGKPPDVPMPIEEVQRLFTAERRLREIEAENQKALDAKEREKLLAMAKAGEAETALEQQRAKYEGRITALETSYHSSLKLSDLANATAAAPFVSPEAARQARALMAERLEVRPEGDSLRIVDRATGRPAAEAVKGWLDSAEFKHFLAPGQKGGAGMDTTPASPANTADQSSARRERLAREMSSTGAGAGFGSPSYYEGLAGRRN